MYKKALWISGSAYVIRIMWADIFHWSLWIPSNLPHLALCLVRLTWKPCISELTLLWILAAWPMKGISGRWGGAGWIFVKSFPVLFSSAKDTAPVRVLSTQLSEFWKLHRWWRFSVVTSLGVAWYYPLWLSYSAHSFVNGSFISS